MSRPPQILWAQRSNKIYLTVTLLDAKDVSVKYEPQGIFKFSATGRQGEVYECELELHGAIVPEGCKTKTGMRNIVCKIRKEQKGWWQRLLKSEEKLSYLNVDWNKWADEDDEDSDDDLTSEDEAAEADEDESSDDDGLLYLPDLEKARR